MKSCANRALVFLASCVDAEALNLKFTLSGNKVCYCTFRATAACPLALFESLPTKGFINLRSTTSSGTLLPLHA